MTHLGQLDLDMQHLNLSDGYHDMFPPPPSAPVRSYSFDHFGGSPSVTLEGSTWQEHNAMYRDEFLQPIPSSGSKPIAFRNLAATQSDSTRPVRFIKADQPAHTHDTPVPSEFQAVQKMYEQYRAKVYIEGYVFKKNEDAGKRALPDQEQPWMKYYVELCGPVLTLWDAEQEAEDVHPQYINIAGATVEIQDDSVMHLKTAKPSRYLIVPADNADPAALDRWVRAVRLSCYEDERIHEIYTKQFIMRHRNVSNGDDDQNDVLSRPMPKMEGFLQVRLEGGSEWQKYWAVVTDRKDEKKLFGKKSVPSQGQVSFFESKKAKQPLMTMMHIVQTYTLYPDTPQLVDLATIIKVEGRIKGPKDEEQTGTPCSALFMTSSPKELVQWLIGVYDAFKLYGRPSHLMRDPTSMGSLAFGETVTGSRLFLELSDVEHVDVRQGSADNSKAEYAQVLYNKMKRHQEPRPMGATAGQRNNSMPHIPLGPPPPSMTTSTPLGVRQHANSPDTGPGLNLIGRPAVTMRSLSPYGEPTPSTADGQSSGFIAQHQQPQPHQQQSQQQSFTAPRGQVLQSKKVYASDDSDDSDEDEADEDDDDSVFSRGEVNAQSYTAQGQTNHQQHDMANPSQTQSGTLEQSPDLRLMDGRSGLSASPHNLESDSELSDDTSARKPAQRDTKTRTRLKPSVSESEESIDEQASDDSSDRDSLHDPHTANWTQNNGNNGDPVGQTSGNTMQHTGSHDPLPPTEHYMNDYEQGGLIAGHRHFQEQNEEGGPVIPHRGEEFADPHSLLGALRNEQPYSARNQEEYARATGQPLVQMSNNKPKAPKSGLVGMISQIEHDKQPGKRRIMEIEKERERHKMELRQTMMMNNMGMGMGMGMMGMGGMNMGMNMGMMDPRMSMMPPNMGMMGAQGMNQPMMDPRMTMNFPMMMDQSRMNMQMMPMMGVPPMMDPRMMNMPMMPAMYANQGQRNNGHAKSGRPSSNEDPHLGNNLTKPSARTRKMDQKAPSPIPSTSRTHRQPNK